MEKEASINHVDSAIQTLKNLNREGGLHRDFMKTKLDLLELREKELNDELQHCKDDIDSVRRHSREVGKEYNEHTQKLAAAAFALITDSSGEISDRQSLWQITAEALHRHYQYPDDKNTYAAKLLDIDTTLRNAAQSEQELPIVISEDSNLRNGFLYGARFAVLKSSPRSNGLSLVDNREAMPAIAYGTSSSDKLVLQTRYSPRPLSIHKEAYAAPEEPVADIILGNIAVRSFANYVLQTKSPDESFEVIRHMNSVLPETMKDVAIDAEQQAIFSSIALESMKKLQFNSTSAVQPYAQLRSFVDDDERVRQFFIDQYELKQDAVHKFELFESLRQSEQLTPPMYTQER